MFTSDIRHLDVPAVLMGPGPLELAVHVELVEPVNSPWARLMVMIAYVVQ
jgi:hypothetical protein